MRPLAPLAFAPRPAKMALFPQGKKSSQAISAAEF